MENATYASIAPSGDFTLPFAVAVRNGGLTRYLNRKYGRFCTYIDGYLVTRDARALVAAVGNVVDVDVDGDMLVVSIAHCRSTRAETISLSEALAWAEQYLLTGGFDEECIETAETLTELITEPGDDDTDTSTLQNVLQALEALNER